MAGSLYRSETGLAEFRAIDYSENVGQGRATHRTAASVPRISDFVADVQLCAYRVLSGEELEHFNSYYRDLCMPLEGVEGAFRAVDRRVRIRLGRALIMAGVFPFQTYVAPFDPRGNRYPERMRRLALRKIGRDA